jgi:hypothetical protein
VKKVMTFIFDVRGYLLIVATFFLVGSASAQQRLLDFDSSTPTQTAAIFRNVNGNWVQLSSRAAANTSAFAGQTIRLRIASTNNRGKLIVGVDNVKTSDPLGGRLYVATDVGVYQVPCEGPATRIGVVSGSQLTVSGTVSDPILIWKTKKEWRGTCRMLAVKLRDGTEVLAKVRFE